ncbi:hypothetical protein CVT24_010128 [Panaeolus cyanescens]|uniref:Fungal-type protein kinase domain-containing protein n=1 Tax=Panaeolus cyanescens TaxID=181874 RepID=A0A409W9M0_9AGAR|nr:hypothetical protein CVT24_010128 [Panaeolus cyanescens]
MSEGVIKGSETDIALGLEQELTQNITPLTAKRAMSILKATVSDKDCARFLKDTKAWSPEGSWKGLPKKAPSHRILASRLHNIVLEIFQYFNHIPNPRKATTQTPTPLAASAPQPERRLHKMLYRRIAVTLKRQPDGLITGTTKHFMPSSKGDSWHRSIAAFDIRTNSERESATDSESWIYDMAYYAQEIFATQRTRQHVYGLVISETHLRIYRFDRCGAVEWPWLNFHDDPTILIRAFLLIGNHDLKTVGVDPTVVFNARNQRQFTMTNNGKISVYTTVSTTFADRLLVDRATMCWVVKDSAGKHYLLKQQFSDVKRPTEGKLLKGVDVPAIAKVYFEQRYEKMSTSRGIRAPFPDTFYDRVMVRSIFDLYGQPIDAAVSRIALLMALHDTISGHRDLWLKHNILHRDISFGNILYAKEENHWKPKIPLQRPHGILIDFDLGIRYDPKQPREKYQVANQTGSTAFQSLNTVGSEIFEQGEAFWTPLHDHTEELESFFWVLYWSTVLFDAPENLTDEQRAYLQEHGSLEEFYEVNEHWENFIVSDWVAAYGYKKDVLREKRDTMAVPKDGWGTAYTELVQSFAKLCNDWSLRKFLAAHNTQVPSTMEESRERAAQDYDTVLNMLLKAMKDLAAEIKAAAPVRPAGKPLREIHQERPIAAPDQQRPIAPSQGINRKRSRELVDETPTDPVTETDVEGSPTSKKGRNGQSSSSP